MNYGIFSANQFIYPDSDIAEGKKEINLVTFKNSVASVQILLKDVGADFTLKAHNLPQPEVNRLIPIFVGLNTGPEAFTVPLGTPAPYSVRQAPFWVFDAMEPVDTVKAEDTVALYLRWQVNQSAKGSIILGDTEIKVNLKVFEVEIPKKETLRLSNWFCLGDIASYHNLSVGTDQYYEMVKKYGLLMREARQTDFYVEFGLVRFDGERFDFSLVEKIGEMFFGLGFSHLEMAPPTYRANWESPVFLIKKLGKPIEVLSKEGIDFLKAYFTAWREFLISKGWLDKVVQHVSDEPYEICIKDYNKIASIIKEIIPEVPLIDAIESFEINRLDIYIPKSNFYDKAKEQYEQKRREGKTLWYYTCCFPGGEYLNRLLDFEAIRTRYLHWANKLYDFKGYLHWGFNFYCVTGNPFEFKDARIENLNATPLPCGDTHIVYPKGDSLLRSVRFEMMRAGVEDYELLCLLEKKDKAKYKEILHSVITSFTQYEKNVDAFEKAYTSLLENL